MWFIYALQSESTGKTYTGISQNPAQRLEQHNQGKVTSTKSGKPWKMIYQESGFSSTESARTREKYLKFAAGKRWLKKQSVQKLGGSLPA